jgi:Uma2 family endonuclease
MAETLLKKILPDIEDIVTEDDEPVDNMFSEKQQRLLTESLNISWNPGRSFIAVANVGVFYDIGEPPVVPDVFVSLDVRMPDDLWQKKNRSYFVREFGKPPEIAVEIVSNREGEETGRKFRKYAQAGVRYYVIFDPLRLLRNEELRVYELSGMGKYIPKIDRGLIKTELGLRLWEGEFDGKYERWLRWTDNKGNLILTGREAADAERKLTESERKRADAERKLTESERKRADAERRRADAADEKTLQAQERAERLARKLRELGISPD